MVLDPDYVLDAEDQIYILEQMKTCFAHDRAHHGFPVLDVYRKTYTSADPLAGTGGVAQHLQILNDIDCDFAPFTDEQVAASGGMISAQDFKVIFYNPGLYLSTTVADFYVTWSGLRGSPPGGEGSYVYDSGAYRNQQTEWWCWFDSFTFADRCVISPYAFPRRGKAFWELTGTTIDDNPPVGTYLPIVHIPNTAQGNLVLTHGFATPSSDKMLDDRNDVVVVGGRSFKILNQYYEHYSGRTELQVQGLTGEELFTTTTTTTTT